MASVPWRCGHSCTAPAQVRRLGVGGLGDQRPGVLQQDVLAGPQHGRDHADRLLDHRRAGRVEDDPARADRVQRAGQQADLQRHEPLDVPAGTPPAALRAPAQGPQARARRIDQDPVEGPVQPRRAEAVAGDDVTRRWRAWPGRPASRGAAAARWPAAGRPARSPGRRAAPPCRPARRTGPASARPAPRRPPGTGPARPAANPRPGPRPARRGQPGSRPGRRSRGSTPSGESDASPPVAPSSSTVDSPGRATSVTRGRSLSAASSASSSSGRARARPSASTIHSGCECRTDRDASRVSIQVSRSWAAILRITALVNPTGLWPIRARTSSTVLVTAAWSGIRMASSWWAPSRSASRTAGSGARPARWSMTAS